MTVVSVYSTFADAQEAERIGRQVIEEQLAACVNILGACRSIYRWQGKIECADEVAAIFKTTSAAADSLIARIAALHSYDVPAVAVWPIEELLESYAPGLRRRHPSSVAPLEALHRASPTGPVLLLR